MAKDLKLKIYPAVIAILGLGLVTLLLSRIQIQVVRNEDNAIPVAPIPLEPEGLPTPSPSAPLPTPEVEPSPTTTPTAQVPVVPVDVQGGLRVRNLTAFPIRVALLPQTSEGDPAKSYSQPVHWDFAPEEGKTKGLRLSLPDRNLKLQAGDVLVAFSQDGSRRYWGPFVVGKTALPTWNNEQQEWLLPLQP